MALATWQLSLKKRFFWITSDAFDEMMMVYYFTERGNMHGKKASGSIQ
jgi:hypothetical protein